MISTNCQARICESDHITVVVLKWLHEVKNQRGGEGEIYFKLSYPIRYYILHKVM